MPEGKTVVDYQRNKSFVTDAINEIRGHAERLESIPAEEVSRALYNLLEAIDYLDRTFESFAYENIPE